MTLLPQALVEPLQAHLQECRRGYEADLALGRAAVYLPDTLAAEAPNAAGEWAGNTCSQSAPMCLIQSVALRCGSTWSKKVCNGR